VGGWASLMVAVAALNLLAGASTHWDERETVSSSHTAGPIDDTIQYLQCVLNMLRGIPCDHEIDHDEPGDPPPMPEDPPA